jgi:hypothetical protein
MREMARVLKRVAAFLALATECGSQGRRHEGNVQPAEVLVD